MPAGASPALVQACASQAPAQSQADLAAQDRETVCLLLCCCNTYPSTSGLLPEPAGKASRKPMDMRDLCVQDTLDAVDSDLGQQSRFKSQVSYNMMNNPPSPYMHRNLLGADTTQRSTNWIGRALSSVSPYTPGQGLTRRPDVVVVNDPTRPPTQDNISQIYELKFNDPLAPRQLQDYQRIAGGLANRAEVLDPQKCDCSSDKKREQVENKVRNAAEGRANDAILQRNRIGRLFGNGGGPLVGPLPGPIAVPLP